MCLEKDSIQNIMFQFAQDSKQGLNAKWSQCYHTTLFLHQHTKVEFKPKHRPQNTLNQFRFPLRYRFMNNDTACTYAYIGAACVIIIKKTKKEMWCPSFLFPDKKKVVYC